MRKKVPGNKRCCKTDKNISCIQVCNNIVFEAEYGGQKKKTERKVVTEKKEIRSENQDEVYCYHTFMLPFVWEGSGKNTVSLHEIKKCFDENPNWVNNDMTAENSMDGNENKFATLSDTLEFYKEYQYFHPYARKAIYGFADDIVSNYSFKPSFVRNKGHYYIQKKGADGAESVTYDLLINGIRLKIFNTGIGIFIIEAENHGKTKEGKRQDTLDAVKNINDYGRRISLPYLTDPLLCADTITLSIGGIELTEGNREFLNQVSKMSLDELKGAVSLTHMCDFVTEILGYGSQNYKFTSRPIEHSRKTKEGKTKIYIYPALDDRMFVASYIRCLTNEQFDEFVESDAYLNVEEKSKSIYELIFIDPAGNCCCHDAEMRREQIKAHTYTRWKDWRTLTFYSYQSLINLTTETAPSYLCESFLTQYVQLACLCQAQRASIINFQRQTSALSEGVERRNKPITHTTVSRLRVLQERFVAFQNQLNFSEVTPQQQGIEIYDKLMELSFIDKEKQILKEQFDALCDAANTSMEYSFNKWAALLAIPALLLESSGVLISILCLKSGEWLPSLIALCISCLIIAIPLTLSFVNRFRK